MSRIRRTNTCDDCRYIGWIEHVTDEINYGYCGAPISSAFKQALQGPYEDDIAGEAWVEFDKPYKRSECNLWEYANPRQE
jgi:hypothetical protein